jgi:type IV pilus assembly protein PilB
MNATDQGVVEVLKHARIITEQQLQRAQREQATSGRSLKDILFREVTWATIKKFLNYEIPTPFSGEKRALGAVLREAEWISKEQIDEAEQEAQRSGEALGHKLCQKKVISKSQLQEAVEQQKETGLPLWRTLIDLGYVNTQQISDVLGIRATAKEKAAPTQGQVERKARKPGDQSQAESKSTQAAAVLIRPEMIQKMTAVEIVEMVVDSAVKARATDIHMDPQEEHMRVRYRIDGMLYDVMQLPLRTVPEVISRFKVLGGMDITQHRHSQDGHFVRVVDGTETDLRLATAPTVLGEKLVVRILHEKNVLKGIAQLGMEPHQIDLIEQLVAKPYGMILTTGPVGSGKTTTLYALLNEVNILTKNVMTVEDPVEYQCRGVNQLQTDAAAGFGFVQGLRAILRQDPNIVMVGEIRDEETAMTAVKAAMTGVLVLSTLHTNDAPGAVSSLVGLNVPRFLISSALIGVVGQRLVRRICPHCKEEFLPPPSVLEQLGVPEDQRARPFYRGAGCDQCFNTGYLGRTGVYELMGVTEELKEAILHGESHSELRRLALKNGMQTLARSTLNKVLDGSTTAEEYLRVIFT